MFFRLSFHGYTPGSYWALQLHLCEISVLQRTVWGKKFVCIHFSGKGGNKRHRALAGHGGCKTSFLVRSGIGIGGLVFVVELNSWQESGRLLLALRGAEVGQQLSKRLVWSLILRTLPSRLVFWPFQRHCQPLTNLLVSAFAILFTNLQLGNLI